MSRFPLLGSVVWKAENVTGSPVSIAHLAGGYNEKWPETPTFRALSPERRRLPGGPKSLYPVKLAVNATRAADPQSAVEAKDDLPVPAVPRADARDIALGGVGSTGNLSTRMIDELRT